MKTIFKKHWGKICILALLLLVSASLLLVSYSKRTFAFPSFFLRGEVVLDAYNLPISRYEKTSYLSLDIVQNIADSLSNNAIVSIAINGQEEQDKFILLESNVADILFTALQRNVSLTKLEFAGVYFGGYGSVVKLASVIKESTTLKKLSLKFTCGIGIAEGTLEIVKALVSNFALREISLSPQNLPSTLQNWNSIIENDLIPKIIARNNLFNQIIEVGNLEPGIDKEIFLAILNGETKPLREFGISTEDEKINSLFDKIKILQKEIVGVIQKSLSLELYI